MPIGEQTLATSCTYRRPARRGDPFRKTKQYLHNCLCADMSCHFLPVAMVDLKSFDELAVLLISPHLATPRGLDAIRRRQATIFCRRDDAVFGENWRQQRE